MKTNEFAQQLMDFIEKSPSCFHVTENISSILKENGFSELEESQEWNLKEGGTYFVRRNSSSIIAFKVPSFDFKGFSMAASHSDSPSFKVKENPQMTAEGLYVKLNVEKYGGMLCAPWFDRPLSVAGRLIVKDADKSLMPDSNHINLRQVLVNVDRDLLMIPNLAIHMNREANDGYKYNIQKDLLPVFSTGAEGSTGKEFMNLVAESAGVKAEDVLSADLYLYNRVKGTFWGANNEFIASTKLDDLECAFTNLYGFLDGIKKSGTRNAAVYCVFDNEEVGSETRQGAASTFLQDTLKRINSACGRSEEQYYTALASSFMVSADNAHAVHPNYGDKADPVNRPQVNKGPVIKFNAAQKYCTDGISAAFFKTVCDNAKVPYQTFTNRSDMAGGSTLGNISGTKVSVSAVDIGLAQWAMHSPYESAGAEDPELMRKALAEFYASDFNLSL